jgi:hypothetical protein
MVNAVTLVLGDRRQLASALPRGPARKVGSDGLGRNLVRLKSGLSPSEGLLH